jgi:transposase-like protein
VLDRGVPVDHTIISRWIQAYSVELEKRVRPHLRISNGSWRVEETDLRGRIRRQRIGEIIQALTKALLQ